MKTLPYLEFQLAQSRYQQAFSQLPEAERASLHAEAIRQWQLQEHILNTELGRSKAASLDAVDAAQATIRERYADEASYHDDLANNGFDATLLHEALARELHVQAVVEEVTTDIAPVTEFDALALYMDNQPRFQQAEARQARHILITINPEMAENTAEAVAIRMKLLRDSTNSTNFADAALRHSECPSALQGGELGWVQRGQLYPELDAVLFDMASGEIRTAQSPMGWHLLLCETIRPAGVVPFEQVSEKLIGNLQAQRQKKALAVWLKANT